MARSTFASQNAQNTTISEQFLKFRCSKMARRCGAKHICKSNCAQNLIAGPIFEDQMSKNCTPLWREAHSQVKMNKTPHGGTDSASSDVQKWHAAVVRSRFASQNAQKLTGTDHFLNCRCGKIARRCGAKHMCKSKCTKHLRFAAF